jgi:hypothetical protein
MPDLFTKNSLVVGGEPTNSIIRFFAVSHMFVENVKVAYIV